MNVNFIKLLLAGFLIMTAYDVGAQIEKGQNNYKNNTVLVSKMDLLKFNMANKLPEITAMPIIYEPTELPIFCKIEHKLLKSAQFNVKIRLGDVSYVDKLEGYK